MIKIIILLAVICASIFLGPYLADSQGFVHIVTNDLVIDTSLTFAVIVIIVSFLLIIISYKIIVTFFKIPKGTFAFFDRRSRKRHNHLQEEAVIAYTEGDYLRAVNLLKKVGKIESLPASSLFILAKAAFNLNDIDLTRKALDCAIKYHKDAKLASLIIKVNLNLQLRNLSTAKQYLDEINQNFKNNFIRKLNYNYLLAKDDIIELQASAKTLVENKIIDEAQARDIFNRYIANQLKEAKTSAHVKIIYKSLNAQDKLDSSIICPLIAKLVEVGDLTQAKKFTLRILANNPSKELYESISTWDMSIPDILEKLEAKANENLIAAHVNVPLLKALGNLELQEGKLEKARTHLEQAMEISKSKDILLKLATVLAMQQQHSRASDLFMKAIANKEVK